MKSETVKKIIDSFNGNFIVLLIVNSENYLDTNIAILKEVTKKSVGVYITLNRPYSSLVPLLEHKKVNTKKIFFIDCVTKTVGGKEEGENVIYLENAQGLTNLCMTIVEAVKALPGENKFLILDTLATLSVYNSEGSVSKFVHFLTNKMRMLKLNGVLLSAEKEMDLKLAKQLEPFVDKTVDISKNGK